MSPLTSLMIGTVINKLRGQSINWLPSDTMHAWEERVGKATRDTPPGALDLSPTGSSGGTSDCTPFYSVDRLSASYDRSVIGSAWNSNGTKLTDHITVYKSALISHSSLRGNVWSERSV